MLFRSTPATIHAYKGFRVDDAGLDSSGCLMTNSYRDTVLIAKFADEMFEGVISRKDWFRGVYTSFNDAATKDIAKEKFSVGIG